ncbi:MAG TPA: hypothetical protein VFN21_03820, partial [Acidimicrobiales bacterium]|nr:hypothetical protein [Acidimicrobiales bacterium]
ERARTDASERIVSRALIRLVEAHPGLLEEGERVVAAGRGRTVAGTDSAAALPPSTIWAVSDRRLFVFDTATRSRRSTAPPLAVFTIGVTLTGVRVESFDRRDALLVVDAPDRPATVVMNPADATAIADAATAALDALAADTDWGPRPTFDSSSHAYADGGIDPSVQGSVEPLDPAGGSTRIARLRALLTAGEVEQSSRQFASFATLEEREWCLRHLGGTALTDGLDAWVDAAPDSANAYLARGAHAVWTADARPEELGEVEFFDTLRAAERDLFWAVELDFADPLAFTPLIRSGLRLGVPLEELCLRFDESVRRGTDLLGVHLETLVALGPLGSGSVAEMLTFARSSSHAAPDGSPLHALVPYAHLLACDAHQGPARRSGSMSSEAIRETELAKAVSIDSAMWQQASPDPGTTAEICNIFAAAALGCGAFDQARGLLTGVARTFHPWSLLTDGDDRYRHVVGTAR